MFTFKTTVRARSVLRSSSTFDLPDFTKNVVDTYKTLVPSRVIVYAAVSTYSYIATLSFVKEVHVSKNLKLSFLTAVVPCRKNLKMA